MKSNQIIIIFCLSLEISLALGLIFTPEINECLAPRNLGPEKKFLNQSASTFVDPTNLNNSVDLSNVFFNSQFAYLKLWPNLLKLLGAYLGA
jgi:hypothetical protein